MGFTRTVYPDRETWLQHRQGLGGSDSGSVCGWGFKTPLQLWEEKVGKAKPQDLSGNERIEFGNSIEEPLRSMYRVMFPEHELTFTPYTILRRDEPELSFAFYTPDGELVEKATGRKGVYESKSVYATSAKVWAEWRDQIPKGYYAQLLKGMAVGDFEFAVLFAILRRLDGDAELRRYTFERADCKEDIKWLIQKETGFWRSVQNRTMPGLTLQF